MLKIIADKNIPFVNEAFGSLGKVTLLAGREIGAGSVKDADILLVRSVTGVGEDLLEGSRVRFVGTATIGTDHVDTDYLKAKGIAFSSAPGSNSNSVAEYVVCALLALGRRAGFSLQDKTAAVIGAGNVGSKVRRKLEALGMKVMLNDPPLGRRTGEQCFLPLEEVLPADIVTLHVPLTYEGIDATHHLADRKFFGRMKRGSILLNTSRGAVVEENSLLEAIRSERLGACVLDVWEDEPCINTELLGEVSIGTAHIAGYSFDGKVNATTLIREAARSFFGVESAWKPVLPEPAVNRIRVGLDDGKEEDAVREIALKAYDIEKDDVLLRQVTREPQEKRGAYFDRLRNGYPLRREFPGVTVDVPGGKERMGQTLEALGFKVVRTAASCGCGRGLEPARQNRRY